MVKAGKVDQQGLPHDLPSGAAEDKFMLRFFLLFLLVVNAPARAAEAIISDADTLKLGPVTYRLDGIDAPEVDQVCLDKQGGTWPCGIEARDRLKAYLGTRAVTCNDLGPDKAYPRRRIGVCFRQGDTISLNQWLVREGLALNFEPYAKGRFKVDQTSAQAKGLGLWRGCFANPQDVRRWNKSKAVLLGASCALDGDKAAKAKVFPDSAAMPPGCSIKGTYAVRARLTGYRGIYHLEGCRSYRNTTSPQRWFCSEEDARAAGFRKAYTC